jgi:malate dehydrogenase
MKISVIGAGNVGGLAAMRLAQAGCGEIALIDIAAGLAAAKALDMQDAQGLVKSDYSIQGAEDLNRIQGSDIIVVTAGLSRKPGMTREDLLNKNALILKDIARGIKKSAPQAIVVVVTNPLDVMTLFMIKQTGFPPNRVFGMGLTLDAARFANLISQELKAPVSDVFACVIGSHGEGMLPIPRLTTVKGIGLDELLDEEKIAPLVQRTFNRGKEIVELFGSGSAYFAPSAAIAEIVRALAKDEKRTLGVSAYLDGEYGIKDSCIGVPCRLGKNGIEQIVKLDLSDSEKEALQKSAAAVKQQFNDLAV